MTPWTLSIDYGTSNTAAAIRHDGGPAQSVRLTTKTDTMPSAVLRTPDGGYRVGLAAGHGQLAYPASFLECPKSELGRPTVMLGDDEVEVAEVVAQTLRHVADKAIEVAGGGAPAAVVLTHPQEWAARRRDALRAAWDLAGIGVGEVLLVPEPVAAVAWFAQVGVVPDGRCVAVFDYGGGTCDVAVLRRRSEPDELAWPFEVVAHSGRDRLGGNTLDELLLSHIRRQLVAKGKDDLIAALADPSQVGAVRTLREQVRSAKEMLSDYEDADVGVAAGSCSASVHVTRSEFDAAIADEVRSARALVADTLRSAEVDPSDLHALYMTGGSSHVPAVHAALETLLGRVPSTRGDRKLVVALGAHHVPAAALAAGPSRGGGGPAAPDPAPGPGPQVQPADSALATGTGPDVDHAGPAEDARAWASRVDAGAQSRHAGHLAVWIDCSAHAGEPAALTHHHKAGDRVEAGQLLATVSGRGWRLRYRSPVKGTLREVIAHDLTGGVGASLFAASLAESTHRGLRYPSSYTSQSAAVWRLFAALGATENGSASVRRILALSAEDGPLDDRGYVAWRVAGPERRCAGRLLVSRGGAVAVDGDTVEVPPAVLFVEPDWLPGDPSPLVLTPDLAFAATATRRLRSLGGLAVDWAAGSYTPVGVRRRRWIVSCRVHPRDPKGSGPVRVDVESVLDLLPTVRAILERR